MDVLILQFGQDSHKLELANNWQTKRISSSLMLLTHMRLSTYQLCVSYSSGRLFDGLAPYVICCK